VACQVRGLPRRPSLTALTPGEVAPLFSPPPGLVGVSPRPAAVVRIRSAGSRETELSMSDRTTLLDNRHASRVLLLCIAPKARRGLLAKA
jgi:hypothetical protein